MCARRQHPWFTLHLPRYLAVMQADTLASNAMIDDEIVAEVVKLGFRRAEVIDSIQKRVQNKARVAQNPTPLYLLAEQVERRAYGGTNDVRPCLHTHAWVSVSSQELPLPS